MKNYTVGFFGFLICYLIMDGIWLGLIAKDSYTMSLQGMLRESYPIAPWIIFYVLYSLAAVHLVVLKNTNSGAVRVAFDGAVMGMAAYGAYNLTNYAILEGWPLNITLKDWAWGTSVTAISSLTSWFVLSRFQTNH